MKDTSKILCVVDPTTSVQPAMNRAAWLAQKTGAQLELFICFYNEYLSGKRLFDAPSIENTRQEVVDRNLSYLVSVADPLRSAGIDVSVHVAWDHPLHEGIVRRAIAYGADVIFKDTHHHSVLQRSILSNTDWNLIRTCPMPLWLVKPRDMASSPTVLASVDPTNENDKPAALDAKILKFAESIGRLANGTTHAFHAFDPRFALATANAFAPVSMDYTKVESEMQEQHSQAFNELLDSLDFDKDSRHLASGATHERLPELVDSLSADLVVMGAISRNRWERLFIGATAEKTLEYLSCDLLVVKPEWFKTPVTGEMIEQVA